MGSVTDLFVSDLDTRSEELEGPNVLRFHIWLSGRTTNFVRLWLFKLLGTFFTNFLGFSVLSHSNFDDLNWMVEETVNKRSIANRQ